MKLGAREGRVGQGRAEQGSVANGMAKSADNPCPACCSLQITSCNRFRHEDVRVQRRHIIKTLLEALKSSGRTTDKVAAYCTDGDSRRSKEIILSYYRALRFMLMCCCVFILTFSRRCIKCFALSAQGPHKLSGMLLMGSEGLQNLLKIDAHCALLPCLVLSTVQQREKLQSTPSRFSS